MFKPVSVVNFYSDNYESNCDGNKIIEELKNFEEYFNKIKTNLKTSEIILKKLMRGKFNLQ